MTFTPEKEYMNFTEAKLKMMEGKTVRFDLTDGYAAMAFRFGKVRMHIHTENGSSTWEGNFVKLGNTLREMGEQQFYVEKS